MRKIQEPFTNAEKETIGYTNEERALKRFYYELSEIRKIKKCKTCNCFCEIVRNLSEALKKNW